MSGTPMGDIGPAAELREAAQLMRERAGRMDAEMDRMVATWEPGYRAEVAGCLGGPAGEMAAPWDQVTVRAVADWLDHTAGLIERAEGYRGAQSSIMALLCARAYLGGETR